MKRIPALFALTAALCGAAPLAQSIEANHRALVDALEKQKVFVSGRRLLRATYICSLTLGGKRYPVTEIVEQVPGAMEPKTVVRAVVLTPALRPVWQVQLFTARPLFCHANSLFFSASVRAEDASSGNEASFFFGGQGVRMTMIDPTHFPTPNK